MNSPLQTNAPSPAIARLLHWVGLATTLGAGAIAAGALREELHGDWRPVLFADLTVPMAPSTALVLLVICAILGLQQCWPTHALVRLGGFVVAGATAAIALLVVVQSVAGWDLDWETWLSNTRESVNGMPVGRMSLLTAPLLLLAALGLVELCSTNTKRPLVRATAAIGLLSGALFTGFITLAYVTGAPFLHHRGIVPMAFSTALTLTLVFFVVFLRGSGAGLLAELRHGVQGKLALAFGLAVVLLAVVAIIAYLGLADIRRAQRNLTQENYANITDLLRFRSNANAERLDVALMLELPRAAWGPWERDLAARSAANDKILRQLPARFAGDVEALKKIAAITAARAAFKAARHTQILTMQEAGQIAEAKATFLGTQTDLHARMRALAADLEASETVETQRYAAESDRRAQSLTGVFIGAVGLSILATIATGLLLNRAIGRFTADRERAAELLRRRSALLRQTEEISHVGGWEFEVATSHLVWSEEVYRIHEVDPGFDANDLTQAINFYHGESRERIDTAFRRGLEHGEPWDLELILQTAKGRAIWVRAVGRTEQVNGKVARLYGHIADITERKRAAESQARLAAIVESSDDAIIGETLDGIVTSWNAGAEKLFGHPAADMVGRTREALLPAERRAEEADILVRIGRGETVRHFETVRLRADGTGVDVSVSVSPIKEADGRIIGSSKNARDITERKRGEAQLRSQAALLDQVNDAIVGADAQFRLTAWNAAAEAIFGWKAEDVLGRNGTELLRTEWPEVAAEEMRRTIAQTGSWRGEATQACQDGTRIPVEISAIVLHDDAGGITGYLSVIRNITERRQTDAAIRQERDLSESLINSLPGVFYLFNAQGQFLRWNKNFERVTGYSAAEFKSLPVLDLFDPAERDLVGQRIKRVFSQGRADVEAHLVSKSGQRTAYYFTGLRTEIEAQPCAIGVGVDVSQRELAQEALRESEQAFRTLAESAPQLVWICQPDGMNIYFNQRWVDYTGLTLAESYGRGWNTPFHPDDQQPGGNAWNYATATGDIYQIECRLRRADGNYHWFLIRGVPMRDGAGKIVKWFGTCTDIDDLKQAEHEIRQLNSRLEQRVRDRTAQLESANQELEAFSFSVSHDLRAPLRAIDSFSRMIVEDNATQLNDEGRRLLGVVCSESRRMGQLIDDLLSFSRLGRQQMQDSAIDMTDLARATFEDATRTQAVVPRFELGALPPCRGDRSMLRQVFFNLIQNAVKFSRQQPQPVITIASTCAEGRLTYSVRDNGVGFDEKFADKLFGVFQRLHSEEEFEGTGVGLALVQRIVHRHGGTVAATGRVNGGATFQFSLPAKLATPP